MKALTLAVLVFIFIGCDKRPNTPTSDLSRFEIVTIEGCEYFKWNMDGFKNITHKGNCKNHTAINTDDDSVVIWGNEILYVEGDSIYTMPQIDSSY